MATYKGRYRPSNPRKYKGDPTNVIYRSSWELKFMKWCDLNESVMEWQSEEFAIPYKHPIDGRFHRYFPDFLVRIKNKQDILGDRNQTPRSDEGTQKTKKYHQEIHK